MAAAAAVADDDYFAAGAAGRRQVVNKGDLSFTREGQQDRKSLKGTRVKRQLVVLKTWSICANIFICVFHFLDLSTTLPNNNNNNKKKKKKKKKKRRRERQKKKKKKGGGGGRDVSA